MALPRHQLSAESGGVNRKQTEEEKNMSSIRSRIVEVAIQEAAPPYGKVSDLVRDADGNRAGWRVLKSYFDEAVSGWSEPKWKDGGKILVGGQWKQITNLEGVQVPGYRVPQPSKPSGVSWCGIFATWVLRAAGHHAWWVVGRGIVGNVALTPGNEGFGPGDVVVIKGGEVHHAVVIGENHKIYGGDGTIDTVNGNSDNQSIIRHSRYTRNQVWYYYKVLD